MELQAGQNTGLTHTAVVVGIAVDGIPMGMELDVSAFMLTEASKVTSDAGMIFYGTPASQDGAVKLESSSRRFDLDLAKVPSSISKIAIAITIDKGLSRGQRFAQLKGITLSAESGEDKHSFALDVNSMSETALILAEVYQRNGQWKLRAVGQGFNGGLGPLAKHYGVDITDDPDAGGTASLAPPSGSVTPTPPPPPPPAAPPPAPRVNLTKITLEKSKPVDRKSTRLNSSHRYISRMPSSA
jgi:tellurite resistance protein TerA